MLKWLCLCPNSRKQFEQKFRFSTQRELGCSGLDGLLVWAPGFATWTVSLNFSTLGRALSWQHPHTATLPARGECICCPCFIIPKTEYRQHQTFSPLFYRNGCWIDENEVSVYFLCFGVTDTRGCSLLAATTQLQSKLTTLFTQGLNLSASDFVFIPSIS